MKVKIFERNFITALYIKTNRQKKRCSVGKLVHQYISENARNTKITEQFLIQSTRKI